MAIQLLSVLAAACLLGSCVFFVLKQALYKNVSLPRRLQCWPTSISITPPKTPLPGEKKKLDAPEATDYSTTFPPSRRFTLAALGLASDDATTFSSDPLENFSVAADKKRETKSQTLMPCGFSRAEIMALDSFPDYAILSGVPLPEPYRDFDIKAALPRPYRPLRWNYHQTMSLAKMEPDWWIELENTYADRIKQRLELVDSQGEGVIRALPGSELACRELMEMVLQFLCARYPHYFQLDEENAIFTNRILDTTTHLREVKPLDVLMQHVPEDFAIMIRDPSNGYYVFRAGIICSSVGWNLGSKIDLKLHEIHAPIPDYKEKMQFSMDRYFAKMPTEKPIQRGSWGLEVDQPLYIPPPTSNTTSNTTTPQQPDPRHAQDPALTLDRCHLRVDWQTLRRLPLSGAIVFNFKALFTPVSQFAAEPFVPALLLKIIDEAKADIMEYKGTWHTEHVVRPALETYARQQVAEGVVPEDWDPRTLDEAPWFPGWEELWRGQQGF